MRAMGEIRCSFFVVTTTLVEKSTSDAWFAVLVGFPLYLEMRTGSKDGKGGSGMAWHGNGHGLAWNCKCKCKWMDGSDRAGDRWRTGTAERAGNLFVSSSFTWTILVFWGCREVQLNAFIDPLLFHFSACLRALSFLVQSFPRFFCTSPKWTCPVVWWSFALDTPPHTLYHLDLISTLLQGLTSGEILLGKHSATRRLLH